MPRPASTRRRHCRRRSRSRSSRRSPRSRQLLGPCRQQPGREMREVQRGGLSRPALADSAAASDHQPPVLPTPTVACRSTRSRLLCERCWQQPGREVQRSGVSRPVPAEQVNPSARTTRRRCRRCGESCLSRRTPSQLACALLRREQPRWHVASFKCPQKGPKGSRTRGVPIHGGRLPSLTGEV